MKLVPIAIALIHARDCLDGFCGEDKSQKIIKEIDAALNLMVESETEPYRQTTPPVQSWEPRFKRTPGPYSWASPNHDTLQPGGMIPINSPK